MTDLLPVSGRSPFRSVEHWRNSLMTLPDNSFFELLRSVFGNIKTPFNKQRLLDDLFILLSRNEIRNVISAYISEQDHKVIAAVALLNEPAPGDLENFFSGELSYAELNGVLINLEERLILYRFSDDKILRLALNPVLEQVLAPFIVDTRPLFPTESADQSPASFTVSRLNDSRIMAALFAFIQNGEEHLKGTPFTGTPFHGTQFRGIRKKILDEGKKIFPGMDLELAVRVLLRLGLFRSEGRELLPNREKISDFGALTSAERQNYWAAGVYLCLDEAGPDEPAAPNGSGNEVRSFMSTRNLLRGLASFIQRFRGLIVPEKRYPEISLRRLYELLGKEEAFGSPDLHLPFESFLAAMEKADLLERAGASWKICRGLAAAPRNNSVIVNDAVIVMDTAFSFILYPEISFADALSLGSFCVVKDLATGGGLSDGTTVSFELTRSSVARGFDQGLEAEGMIKLLDRLSGNRIDANLGWTLKEWENRYAGVSLHQGIILTLAEDRRYLAETEPVASLIRKTLAPGIYLLSSEERAEVSSALMKVGVDIVAQPPVPSAMETSYNSFPPLGSLSDLPSMDYHQNAARNFPAEASGAGDKAGAIQENFYRVLDKMKLSKSERDELTARIERRLVLSEAQLEGAYLRYEKLEARGLDYAGKSVIARQAIEAGSLVEVSWPGPEGKINSTVGVPQALEKKGGESVLVLDTIRIPGNTVRVPGNTVRVPLGKISLLRRIKQSIFEG